MSLVSCLEGVERKTAHIRKRLPGTTSTRWYIRGSMPMLASLQSPVREGVGITGNYLAACLWNLRLRQAAAPTQRLHRTFRVRDSSNANKPTAAVLCYSITNQRTSDCTRGPKPLCLALVFTADLQQFVVRRASSYHTCARIGKSLLTMELSRILKSPRTHCLGDTVCGRRELPTREACAGSLYVHALLE